MFCRPLVRAIPQRITNCGMVVRSLLAWYADYKHNQEKYRLASRRGLWRYFSLQEYAQRDPSGKGFWWRNWPIFQVNFLGFLVALWSGDNGVRLQRNHKEYSYQGGFLFSDRGRIDTVCWSQDPSSKLPENRCACLKNLHSTHSFDFICGCSTSSTLSLLARFAATQHLPMLSDVTKVVNETTFQRFVYAGNAIETVQYTSHPQVCPLCLSITW